MSVSAMAWAMDQNVPPTPSHVLLILANYANEDGICWPAIATIGSKTRLSERAIRAALRALEDAEVIVRLTAGKGGRATSTPYQLCMGKAAANAGFNKKTRRDVPPNGHDTRHSAPGKAPVVTAGNPASGAINPAPAAPEPSRTTNRKVEPPFSPPQQAERPAEKTALPDWMPREWQEWETYRRVVAPRTWTPQVRDFSMASLDALRRDGHDPAAVIRQAIAGGFTGFRPLPQAPAPRRETVAGYFARVGSSKGVLDDDAFADLDIIPPTRRLQ